MPTITIDDVLNNNNAEKFELFKTFIKENPAYLHEENTDGDLPIHVAIRKGDKRLVEFLIEQGTDIERRNRRGDSALRLANKLKQEDVANYHEDIAKYLVVHYSDLASGFDYATDFRTDLPRLALQFLGVWFLAAASLFAIGVVGAAIAGGVAQIVEVHDWDGFYSWRSDTYWPGQYWVIRGGREGYNRAMHAAFMGTFLTGLWISAIIAAVIGLVITLYVAYQYVQKHYVIAPGYLGEQQVKLIEAIDSNDANALEQCISENAALLFAPAKLFGGNVLDLLCETKKGRGTFIKLLPTIIHHPNVIEKLLASKAVTEHPELFRELVNKLPADMIWQHQNQLFNIFIKQIKFFKKHAAESTLMFAKMTATRPLLEDIYPSHDGHFIVEALERDNSPWGQLANGYIALGGLFGKAQNLEKAHDAFSAVPSQDQDLYLNAQAELGALSYARCAALKPESKEWLNQYFTAFAHFNEAASIRLSQPSSIRLRQQENCKEFLSLRSSDSGHIFNYLRKAKAFNVATATGEIPLLIAAKAGHWELVTAIAKHHRSNNQAQYDKTLLIAAREGNAEVAKKLMKSGARPGDDIVNENGNNALHEAIRLNNKELLSILLTARTGIACQNKQSLSPIEYAAKLGHWDCVLEIVRQYPQEPSSTQAYGRALYFAVQSKQHQVIQCLVTAGTKDSGGWYPAETKNSPLHVAIQDDDFQSLELLLQSDKDLTQLNAKDEPPIVLAATLGKWDMVKKIAQSYRTPEDDSWQYNKSACMAIQARRYDEACVLVEQGALNGNYIEPSTGDSFWHLVIAQNNLQLLKQLLAFSNNSGLLYTLKNKQGFTPFVLAAQENPVLATFIATEHPYRRHGMFSDTSQDKHIATETLNGQIFPR